MRTVDRLRSVSAHGAPYEWPLLMGLVMEHQSDIPGEAILTTETRQVLGERIALTMVFGAAGVWVSVLSYIGKFAPFGLLGDCAFGLMAVLLLFSIPLFHGALPFGVWTINSEGLGYQLYHWRRRFLPWHSVERIRWRNRNHYVIFQGDGIKIRLRWDRFPKETAYAARAIIETQLATEFDLKPVIEEEQFTFSREQRRRLVKLTVISITVTALIFAIPLLAFTLMPAAEWWIAKGFALTILPVLCAMQLIPFLVLSWEEDRAGRRIHPEWPWRVRRSKTKSSLPVDREFELA